MRVHSADTVYEALRRMADGGILAWAEGDLPTESA